MIRIRRMRLTQAVAVLLVLAMYVAPGIGGAAAMAAPKAPPAVKPTVVVFPFDTQSVNASETLGADIAASVKATLGASGKYDVITYSERLPSIQRAVAEQVVKKEDVGGPFGTEKSQKDRAVRIAELMGVNVAVVGTVDDYKLDSTKNVAELTATVQIIDMSNKSVLNTLAVTGKSPDNPKSTAEAELVALAAGDMVTKIAAGMLPEGTQIIKVNGNTGPAPVTVPATPKKKSKSWLLALLLGVGLAVAAGGGGGGGSNDGGGDPPPPPY